MANGDLTDLASVKLAMRISSGDTGLDADIPIYISEASRVIESYCDRCLSAQDYDEVYNGRAFNALLLFNYPVNGGPGGSGKPIIHMNPQQVWDSSSLVDEADYFVDDKMDIQLLNGRRFSNGFGNVRVQYNAGYSTIPEDLKGAASKLAAWLLRMDTNKDIGRTTKTKGAETVNILQDIPPLIIRMIERYRRMELPDTQKPIKVL